MAGNGYELARAFVTLVPSMEGAKENIINALAGADAGADAAGKSTGIKFAASLKGALAPILTGAALLGAGKGLYEVGAIFDEVSDTIRIGTGASGEALAGLEKVAKNIGSTVPAEFGNIAPVVADLNTRLGLSGDTLQTVASQYLEAGRILGQDVDIQTTTAAFNAFKIEGGQVEGAMDALFRVSQATGVGMNELAGTVGKAAPALTNLGFSFQDSAAMAGILDKAGMNAQQVMQSMAKGMVTLAKDGEAPAEAFKRVTKELQGFVDKGDTASALDLASKIFGTKGASQFVAALQSGKLNMDDLMSATGATGDTILGLGSETADFAESWQMVKNNALLALEPLGSAVFSALGSALAYVTPLLQGFSAWAQENPSIMQAVVVVLGALAVALGVAAAAQWAMNSAVLANPATWIIAAIIAAIALLIAAGIAIYENWEMISAKAHEIWQGIYDFFAELFNSIFSTVQSIWNEITGFLTNLWNDAVNNAKSTWNEIAGFFRGLWDGIKNTATNIWNGIVSFITGIPSRIFAGLQSLGQLGAKAAQWFMGFVNGAKQKFGEAVAFVSGIPGKIVSALGNVGSLLVNAGRRIMDGLLNGLKSAWEGVKNFVTGIGDWIYAHKGPKEYDLGLLVPAGGWIMKGLGKGLMKGLPGLETTLDAVSEKIESGITSSPRIDASITSTSAGLPDLGSSAAGKGITVNQYIETATTPSASKLASDAAASARVWGMIA